MTWANEGVWWELMLIHNTADWKMYVEAALQCGWLPSMLIEVHERPDVAINQEVDDEGTTSAGRPDEGVTILNQEDEGHGQADARHGTEIRAQGVADEGERIPAIMEQMQNEDVEAAQMQECGDSSDDEYPIPSEWREHVFGNPVVHHERHEYEYRRNEVVQGQNILLVMMLKKR